MCGLLKATQKKPNIRISQLTKYATACSAKRLIKKGEILTAAFFIDSNNKEFLFDRLYAGRYYNAQTKENTAIEIDMKANKQFKEYDYCQKWAEELPQGIKTGNYKMGITGLADKNGLYKQLPNRESGMPKMQSKQLQPEEKKQISQPANMESKFLSWRNRINDHLNEESKKEIRAKKEKTETELRNPQSLSPDSRVKQQIV